MQINIQAPWEVNTYLRTIIEEKLNKLEQYYSQLLYADVFLKITDHSHNTENKHIEIRLKVPGDTLFADCKKDVFEKGAAECFKKLKIQLVKHKEKRG